MQRKRGGKKYALLGITAGVGIVVLAALYLHSHTVAVLSPQGIVAEKERHLMIVGLLLSAIVVLPVYALAIAIILKYRVGNKKTTKYHPDWDHSWLLETAWWAIPIIIIGILSVIAWQSSYSLDPYKPLASSVKPLNVQVVALDWKWLFIYPEQHVASVNMLEVPVGTPVRFSITSDTVMNSFWIPSLGGQIYAMPGMSTQLNLMASKAGDYHGSPANISGKGFSDMTFTTRAVSNSDFSNWVQATSQSKQKLDLAAYNNLAKPGTLKTPMYYSAPQSGLYNYTVMKYMEPGVAL
jgi:cytochrome o ubiquinol oxidase subunit II